MTNIQNWALTLILAPTELRLKVGASACLVELAKTTKDIDAVVLRYWRGGTKPKKIAMLKFITLVSKILLHISEK